MHSLYAGMVGVRNTDVADIGMDVINGRIKIKTLKKYIILKD